MVSKMHTFKGYLCVILSAFCFAISCVLLKVIYNDGLKVDQAYLYKNGFQLIFAITVYLCQSNQQASKFTMQEFINTCIVALQIVIMNVSWAIAIYHADPANTTAIYGILPLSSAISEYIFLGNRIPWLLLLITNVFCVSGLILVIQPPFIFAETSTSASELFGYAMGAISTIDYAIYASVQRIYKVDGSRATLIGTIGLIITWLIAVYFSGNWEVPSNYLLALLALIAFFKTFAYYLSAVGSQMVDPTVCGLLWLLEIPLIYVFEPLILGIVMNYLVYVGAFIILVSVAYYGYKATESLDSEKLVPMGAGTIDDKFHRLPECLDDIHLDDTQGTASSSQRDLRQELI